MTMKSAIWAFQFPRTIRGSQCHGSKKKIYSWWKSLSRFLILVLQWKRKKQSIWMMTNVNFCQTNLLTTSICL